MDPIYERCLQLLPVIIKPRSERALALQQAVVLRNILDDLGEKLEYDEKHIELNFTSSIINLV